VDGVGAGVAFESTGAPPGLQAGVDDSAAVRNNVVIQVRMSPEASATAEPVRIARSAVSGRMIYFVG